MWPTRPQSGPSFHQALTWGRIGKPSSQYSIAGAMRSDSFPPPYLARTESNARRVIGVVIDW